MDPRKEIFAAVAARRKNVWADPGNILAMDNLLDALGIPRAGDPPPASGMQIGAKGLDLIKQFEGCARKRPDGMIEAYPDPGTGGDPWTIGWGATHMYGRRVKRGDVLTQAQADGLLHDHMQTYAAEVRKQLGDAPTTQDQFDAMVSFHYNTGAIARATLTKKHLEQDYEAAAREFGKWTRAGGKVMRGLTRRREAEAKLYKGEA